MVAGPVRLRLRELQTFKRMSQALFKYVDDLVEEIDDNRKRRAAHPERCTASTEYPMLWAMTKLYERLREDRRLRAQREYVKMKIGEVNAAYYEGYFKTKL